MNALHPRTVLAWRLAGILSAMIFTAAVLILELLVLLPEDIVLLQPGAITGATAALALVVATVWPTLRYRYWRWAIHEDRLLIQKGVIWRSRSLIPRVRIQHVDTRTSPLQRWLGLASLIIYTAGTRGADVEIPGLEPDEAERLREELARLEEIDERP